MKKKPKEKFKTLLDEFKNKIITWENEYKELEFIYNKQLDSIDINKIKYILVADNPGEKEKLHKRYLVGESGVASRCFFKAELNISDFDSEVLVLNKTPIYSNTTKELVDLYGKHYKILIESQEYMCNLLFEIHKIIQCNVFIMGFSECRNGGKKWIVENHKNERSLPYFFRELINLYGDDKLKEKIHLYKHFSMMQFFRDISNKIGPERYNDLEKQILKLGESYRKELMP